MKQWLKHQVKQWIAKRADKLEKQLGIETYENDADAFYEMGKRITIQQAWTAGWVMRSELKQSLEKVNNLLQQDIKRLERERDEALISSEIHQANRELWKGKYDRLTKAKVARKKAA